MTVRMLEELSELEKLSLIDISYSRLDTYDMCHAKYFYSYIQREERVFGAAASLGNMVHAALEAVDWSEELNLLELHRSFESQRAVYDPETQIPNDLIDVGYAVLTDFVDRHGKDQFNVLGVEMPFSMVVGRGLINGYIDRVDDEGDIIRIVDYKAQPLDTKILTPLGYTYMGNISVGDMVIGQNGKPTEVIGVYPQGIIPAYRITFTDGSSTICSQEHLWDVDPIDSKRSIKPLSELGPLTKQYNYRYSIPTVEPVEFSLDPNLPIPPYIMGVILGDGGLTGTSLKIYAEDIDIHNRIRELLPDNLTFKVDYKNSWRISSTTRRNQFVQALKSYGLWRLGSPFKFIPQAYLRAPIEDRLELLRGLMDTDGGCSTRTDFRTSSIQLRDGVIELLRSLGANPTTSTAEMVGYKLKDGSFKKCRPQYIVNTRSHFNPFYLPRKADHWIAPKGDNARRIKSIEHIPDLPMQCIRVENEDGLYVTEDYIVTHNTGKYEITYKSAPDNLQLGIYALATATRYPGRTIRGELYYLRSGRRKGHTYTEEDLLRVEDQLSDRIDTLIGDVNFTYTANSRVCSFCDYRKNGTCSVGMGRYGGRD